MIPQLPKLIYAGEIIFTPGDTTLVQGDGTTLTQIQAGDEFIIKYDPPLIFQAAGDAENLVAGSVVSSFELEVGWPGATGSDSGYVVLTEDLTTEHRRALLAVDVISTYDYLPSFEGQDVGYHVLSIDGDGGSPTTPTIYRLTNLSVVGEAITSETNFIGYEAGQEFGDMTNADEAFAGTSNKVGADCATAEGESTFIGQHSPSRIARAFISGSTDFGYVGETGSPSEAIAASVTIELRGAPDGSPTPDEQDGTLLGSITFTNQSDESDPREISSSDQTTEFGHFWFRVTSDASPPDPQVYYVSRVEFHAPATVETVTQELGWEAVVELPLIQYAGEVAVENGETNVVGDATSLATVLSTHTLIVNRSGTTQLADVSTSAVEEAPQPLTGVYFRIDEPGWPEDDQQSPESDEPSPALPPGAVSAYRIDTTNGGTDGPLETVDRIGDFSERASYDDQVPPFSFASVDGIGGEEEAKQWDRVGDVPGVWKAIELPQMPSDDFENPIRNPQGYVTDPYIEAGEKGDLDLLQHAGWYLQTQTFGAEASEADTDLTFNRGLKLTKTTSTGRLGPSQIILKANMPHLFGQRLVLLGKVRVHTNEGSPAASPAGAGAPVVGVAVCSDTLTDDTPIDLVEDWDNPTLAKGSFFRTESPDELVVDAASTINLVEGEMMPFALEVDGIDENQGRLILFAWTGDALDPGDTLEITEWDLRVVEYKTFKPKDVEREKVPVSQAMPETATFAIAEGYTTSHSRTLIDPFPGEGTIVTMSVEADQWFQRNATCYVSNKKDPSQAFRIRVTEYDGSTLTGVVNMSNGSDANDDWVVSLAPGVPSGGGATITSFSFVGYAEDSNNGPDFTVTLNTGNVEAGDLLVWADHAMDNVNFSKVIPAGFQEINTQSRQAGTGTLNFHRVLAAKLADGSEDGDVITGMSRFRDAKTLLCFRPDEPADFMTIHDVAGQATAGTPTNQTINAATAAAPVLKIASYGLSGDAIIEDIDPRGWDTTKDGEVETNATSYIRSYLAWEIDNVTPADTVVSMQDEVSLPEQRNILQSCYITAGTFQSEPGDAVIFEDDGTGQAAYPSALVPEQLIGAVVFMHAVPPGGLLANGASYLRADFPRLFAKIGTTHGAADADHFNVPDVVTGNRTLRASGGSLSLGNTQTHAVEDHRHGFSSDNSRQSGASPRVVSGTTGLSGSSGFMSTGNSATETRMNNMALVPVIFY